MPPGAGQPAMRSSSRLWLRDVLEHLDRQHAIEALRTVEDADVCDRDLEVGESEARRFRGNVGVLRP